MTPGSLASGVDEAASAQVQALRRQARVELRAAMQQLNARGMYYSSRWVSELVCQIDVRTASSVGPSTVTSAMQSRLHSNSKAAAASTAPSPAAASASRGAMGGLAPPSFAMFDEVAGGGSRRQTISTQLLFGTPAPSTGTGAPPVSAFPPLASPLLSPGFTSKHAPSSSTADIMHDTPPPSRRPASNTSARLFLPDSLRPAPPAWDELAYAKSLFELKEFARCAHVLRDVPLLEPPPRDEDDYTELVDPAAENGPNSNANQCLFLRCYALYLAGEKRKEEELLERGKTADAHGPGGEPAPADAKSSVVNRELRGLQSLLAVVLQRDASSVGADGQPIGPHARFQVDGFLWFLYGLVLRDLGLKSAGRQALLLSVTLFPWNWSAWQALAAFQRDRPGLEQTMEFLNARQAEQHALLEAKHEATMAAAHRGECAAPGTFSKEFASGAFMKEFFFCDVLIQLQSNGEDESLAVLEQLCAIFPDSVAVRSASAMAYYNKRMFPEAQHLFELLMQLDPYRWEHTDTYSNILYVKDDKAKLSALAHQAYRHDKYRLQTCCIVGNYYSSRGARERAILYFKRALRLNPNYLSAWTLMGHEYVELRNTNMAIESYRKAIDINPLDYRAWYGLGQTYEILQMNQYSIYYFKKACEIKPYDPRMWCAIGENYEKLSQDGAVAARVEDAIHCYLRAEAHEDVEGVALHKLAQLYRRRGQIDVSASYYRKVLQRHQAEVEPQDEQPQDQMDTTTQSGADHPFTPTHERTASAHLAGSVAASGGGGGGGGGSLSMPLSLHADAVDAMLFLGEYCFKHAHQYAQAEAYCNRLLDMGGPSKDQAKALLAEIRQRKAHQQQLRTGGPPSAQPKRTPLAPTTGSRSKHTTPAPMAALLGTPIAATPEGRLDASMASSPGFFTP